MTLKSIFDNYKEFEEIIKHQNNGTIDLKDVKLNPTTVLPLLCECKNNHLKIFNGENAFQYLENRLNNDMFFSKLPKSRIESDETDFLTNFVENLDSEYGGYFVLRHTISELANNVYDHSKIEISGGQSYIFAKLHEDYKKLDLCVIDDGLSIPRLFEKSNVSFENDCKALEMAINVFSTVSNNDYERGNGLRTIVRLIAEGNGGEILIVSRNAGLHICGKNYRYYSFDDEFGFDGTLVSIRLNKFEVQNIYELLEPQKLNNYKYNGAIYDC